MNIRSQWRLNERKSKKVNTAPRKTKENEQDWCCLISSNLFRSVAFDEKEKKKERKEEEKEDNKKMQPVFLSVQSSCAHT